MNRSPCFSERLAIAMTALERYAQLGANLSGTLTRVGRKSVGPRGIKSVEETYFLSATA
jgi:hypothetical protein